MCAEASYWMFVYSCFWLCVRVLQRHLRNYWLADTDDTRCDYHARSIDSNVVITVPVLDEDDDHVPIPMMGEMGEARVVADLTELVRRPRSEPAHERTVRAGYVIGEATAGLALNHCAHARNLTEVQDAWNR